MDITVAFISTQLKWKEEADILFKPSIANGLKKDSLIRLTKLATIDKDLAIGLLGRLNEKQIKAVNKNLKILFKLD